LRVLRSLWITSAAATATLGLLGAYFSMTAGAVIGTAVFAGVVGSAARQLTPGRDGGARFGWFCGPMATAGAAAVAGVCFVGLFAFFGAAAGAFALVLAAAWPTARYVEHLLAHRRPSGAGLPDDAAGLTAPSAEPAPAPTHPRLLTDQQLCLAWRTSFALMQNTQDAAEHSRLADLRAGYLDELEHRNPTGFTRWMVTGARAASDPGRYLAPGSE